MLLLFWKRNHHRVSLPLATLTLTKRTPSATTTNNNKCNLASPVLNLNSVSDVTHNYGLFPLSWVHTPTGAPNLVIVGIVWVGEEGLGAINSVTYGALSLTYQVGGIATGAGLRADFYIGLNPPPGSQTITITTDYSEGYIACGSCFEFSGANTTTPIGYNSAQSYQSGTAPSISLGSINLTSICLSLLGVDEQASSTTATVGSGEVEQFNNEVGFSSPYRYYQLSAASSQAPSGNGVMNWTLGASHNFAHAALEVRQSLTALKITPKLPGAITTNKHKCAIPLATLTLTKNAPSAATTNKHFITLFGSEDATERLPGPIELGEYLSNFSDSTHKSWDNVGSPATYEEGSDFGNNYTTAWHGTYEGGYEIYGIVRSVLIFYTGTIGTDRTITKVEFYRSVAHQSGGTSYQLSYWINPQNAQVDVGTQAFFDGGTLCYSETDANGFVTPTWLDLGANGVANVHKTGWTYIKFTNDNNNLVPAGEPNSLQQLNAYQDYYNQPELCCKLRVTHRGPNYLVITGKTPSATVTQNHKSALPTANLSSSANVPGATTTNKHFSAIPSTAFTLTPRVPSATVVANNFSQLPVAALTLTVLTPSAITTEKHFSAISRVSLALSNQPPGATTTNKHLAAIPSKSLSLSPHVPQAWASDLKLSTIPAAILNLIANVNQATVTLNVFAALPSKSLAITSYPPGASTTTHHKIALPVASLTLSAKVPKAAVPVVQFLEIIDAARLRLNLTADELAQVEATRLDLTLIPRALTNLKATPLAEFEAKHAPTIRGLKQGLSLEAKTSKAIGAKIISGKNAETQLITMRAKKRTFNIMRQE